MKRMKWLLLGLALVAHAAFAQALPTVTFTLDPLDGILSGAQSTSVGWGYSISTDSGYLLINSITFEDTNPFVASPPAAPPFSTPGIPFATISNGSSATVPWVLDTSGLQYFIDAAATVGAQTSGWMDLNFQWWDNENLEGNPLVLDVCATNGTLGSGVCTPNGAPGAVIAEVNVLQGTEPQVPEPGGLGLLGAAFLAVMLRRKNAKGR
jgi:PEP-CTERM motif